ncbi:gluconokinase [Opitutaceae bacterium]|nr:gluconokinase [Opitutaceae bacterium]
MTNPTSPQAVVVMGVCGTGKSTVGLGLADRLGFPYADADDYHPAENVAKMREGIALNDEDREPWLDRLRGLLEEHLSNGTGIVLACSALRQIYRDRLKPAHGELKIVFLRGDRELLAARMAARTDHYMPPTLLDSQLATLEVPAPRDALWCDVADAPETIIANAHRYVFESA